jgi:hypothetical protein
MGKGDHRSGAIWRVCRGDPVYCRVDRKTLDGARRGYLGRPAMESTGEESGRTVSRHARELLKRLFTCSVVVCGFLADTPTARADLGLVFPETRAVPGQRVGAFSGDNRGRPSRFTSVKGIRLYLVPMADAKSPANQRPTGPPRNPSWRPLGRLHLSADGVARLSFVVPNLAPGDYTIGFWCRPCAPPRGATFTTAYPGTRWRARPFGKVLRLTARPAAPPTTDSTQRRESESATPRGARFRLIAGLLACAALVGVALVVRRSHAGRRERNGPSAL